MKILVVEDDRKIAMSLSASLLEAGYSADIAHDGKAAWEFLKAFQYRLLITDLMLPEMDGLELVERVRAAGKTLPVLILSAKRTVDDRIVGLQKGGDDYLVKPFDLAEMLARVQALLRRSNHAQEQVQIRYGELTINLNTREVFYGLVKIELQAKEFSLLEYFMRNPEVILSKSMILEKIWNYKFDPQTNVVDVLVCRLRNKIDKICEKKLISNIRGIGYVFKNT